MATPNILLTRIDNRLVHGQVGVLWTTSIGANLLVVVDGQAANEPLQQQLMKMTADSSGVGIRFFTIQQTIDTIHKASAKQQIFIVCKTPDVVCKLVDGGVPIDKVNVGNMHMSEGKKQITNRVFLDEKDIKDLNYLHQKGIQVFIQNTPGDPVENINSILQ